MTDSLEIITDPLDAISCSQCGAEISLAGMAPFSEVACPACGTEHKVPVQFGKFYLTGTLGKGGMGAVYQALDSKLGRYVAIKVMARSMSEDQESLGDFLREARNTAALNHRNVVQIYEADEDDHGQPYIVMEMVSGGRFDILMKGGRQVDEIKTLEVGIEVAKGLMAAHNIGLIHGDIKPANILFGEDGSAKVVDFGLARFMASQQEDTGEIWGTPFYVAPEKVKRLGEDQRSDLYSLGATLYHALAGHPPFDGDTATDVVLARLNGPAPDIRDYRSDVHDGTARVLNRMLEEEPSRRHPNYRSLVADLEEALEEARADSGSRATGRYASAGGGEKSKAPVFAVIGIALLVVIIGAVVLSSGKKEQPSFTPVQAVDLPPGAIIDTGQGIATGPEMSSGPVQPSRPTEDPDWLKPAPGKSADTATAEPEDAMSRHPFTKDNGEGFMSFGEVVGSGSVSKAAYADAIGAYENGTVEQLWVKLLYAMHLMLEGESIKSSDVLNEVEAECPSVPAGSVNSILSAAGLHLRGQNSKDTFRDKVAGLDGDSTQVRYLIQAVRAVIEQDYKYALRQFRKTSKETFRDEYAWVNGFRPMARAMAQQLDTLDSTTEQAEDLVASGHGQQARNLISNVRNELVATLHVALSDIEKRIGSGGASAPESVAAAPGGGDPEADRAAVLSARGSAWPLLKAKDFDKACQLMRSLKRSVGSAEGRDYLDSVIQGYEELQTLHEFLISQVQQRPFGAAKQRELGGTVTGANNEGLMVDLGSGRAVRAWPQVDSSTYVWMIDKYVASSGLTSADKAKMFGAAALFCYEGRGFVPARRFAEMAAAADSGITSVLKKRMPNLAP